MQHLLEHFVDHARNQNLGIIANAWLAHANQSSPGCSQCLELAQLHSMSVDFPKTGVPATMPRELVSMQGAVMPVANASCVMSTTAGDT